MEAKALTHNSRVTEGEPAWSDVDKTKLPRNAFADQGDAAKKSTWGYPHHFVEGGGELSDSGVYTTGTMFLHRGGLAAAWAAAQGARAGEEASAAVKEHLQAHRAAIGMGDENKSYTPKSGDRRSYSFRFEGKVVAPENSADGKSGVIEGYASTFGNVDLGNEVIDAGAFTKTIQESIPKRAVKLLVTHLLYGAGTQEVIGTVVEAKEDERGLWIKAMLASTQTAQDVRTLVQEGHVSGLSIGFEMLRWEIAKGENGAPDILHHKEVRLLEVTVTAFPMNPEAMITSAKSFGSVATSIRKRLDGAPPADRAKVAEEVFGKDAGWDTLGEAFASLGAVLRGLAKDEPKATTAAPVAPVAGPGLAARESIEVRKRRARALLAP